MSRLAKLAWSVLGLNLAVVAWGAYVRASGSGAGCGAHWPLCQGEVVPRSPRLETIIELSHRVSSGVALVAVLALAIAATVARSPARRPAWAAFGFICAEALIGAGLVLFALVAHDASVARALSMGLHLANTFFLLAALALTAWRASGGEKIAWRRPGGAGLVIAAALFAVLVVATTGAVTALGDTLFPAASLKEGVAQDLSPTAHLFVKLRVVHPFLAVATSALVLAAAAAARVRGAGRRGPIVMSRIVTVAFFAQLAVGVCNVALLAPIPVQLLHLLCADAVWIALVLLGAVTLPELQPIMSRNGPAPSSDVPPSTSSVAPVT